MLKTVEEHESAIYSLALVLIRSFECVPPRGVEFSGDARDV